MMTEHTEFADIPQVAVNFMNQDHDEAMALLERVVGCLADVPASQADSGRLRDDLRDFIEHSRAHFRREEVLMKAVAFPPFQLHKQEHDARLEDLVACVDDLDAGVIDLADLRRVLVEDFVPWYQRHCATMDKATARFVARRGAESAKIP
ncbi:bacteriohemerythrin [Ectothiorhodospira lacustris]|uniref:bacteriohemerythrin n=1 Tax=Ectothiorhodospira lacustris TaxID=2899127 RepID=UPI001EE8F1F3|nr:hemerythrin family protein [Ectothiorhodospira lacustris]MCG5500331.1 hemerythrin family protein [Ectothiorhodospira lacustris]MCG5510127.1 hemerythrin family protein [Ectothiorhodospira lacustris]MCG5521970.1 hemerythrin family protein [Ectothiorhodospira lacustris]